jgi:hypothetical protein
MSAKQRWVAAIVGLLVANVIAMIVLMSAARGRSHSRVVPGYQGIVEKK